MTVSPKPSRKPPTVWRRLSPVEFCGATTFRRPVRPGDVQPLYPVRSWPPRRPSTRLYATKDCPSAISRFPWVSKKAKRSECSILATPQILASWRKRWPASETLGGFRGGSRLISPLWSLLGRRAGRRRERLSLDLSSCSQNRRRYIERRSGIKYLPLVGHRIVDRRPHRLWPRRSFAQDASVHPRGVGLACSSLVSGG